MPGSSNNGGRSGNRNNGKKSESKQALEGLKSACPPHKKRDFDLLVKQLNGDEARIQQKIQEWWEEPQQPQEEAWEDVNKKAPVPGPKRGGGGGGKFRDDRGDRGDRGGRSSQNSGGGGGAPGRGGRDGRGRGRGGRGGRGDRKVRDNDGPPPKQQNQQPAAQRDESNKKDNSDQPAPQRVGVPKPVTNAPVLKGAWGKSLGGGQPASPATPASPEKPAAQPQQPASAAPQPPTKEPVIPVATNMEVGVASKSDPTPAGLAGEKQQAQNAGPVSGGNVWATKGSAHLIRAEKPKPPAPAAPVVPCLPPTPVGKSEPQAPEPIEEAVASALETGLPPSVAMAPWGKEPAQQSRDIPASPQAVKASMAPSVEAPVAVPKPAAAKPPRPAPTNVLNMGHWETGDNDDSQNMDFGFGSFGTEDVAPAMESAPTTAATPPNAAAATNASPARPPPGLSIGGMPPMPANAVLVHELEHSLENSTLNAAKPGQQAPAPQENPITNPLPPQPNGQVSAGAAAPVLPGQQNYNQYGMPGMYNYNAAAAGSGFVGVHAAAAGPFMAGVGVIPQQQQPPKAGGISPQPGAAPGVPTHNLPQAGGLYGHAAPASGNAPDTGNASSDANNSNPNAAAPGAPGMPPGMPGMPPYNPNMYYGQQPFHVGQHQQGMGYNYGYGAQFGGVQGGFGYQQVMGQTQGYGAPHYGGGGDEQHQQAPPHQGNAHGHHTQGGSGGYQQKNSGGGGYRGRNNHHNNNQYQNQYNPQQHGGYGGQPYAMGYNHPNQQHGGYGHNMGDPYGMQPQQQQGGGGGGGAGGFQDDNDQHNKGRKGGANNSRNNNNNNSLPQFQGGPMSGGAAQQQPFGLQGQSNDSAPTGTAGGTGGWSNNNQAAGGGGGWSGGSSGWQQGN